VNDYSFLLSSEMLYGAKPNQAKPQCWGRRFARSASRRPSVC